MYMSVPEWHVCARMACLCSTGGEVAMFTCEPNQSVALIHIKKAKVSHPIVYVARQRYPSPTDLMARPGYGKAQSCQGHQQGHGMGWDVPTRLWLPSTLAHLKIVCHVRNRFGG
ncbi:hypothetical protein BC936DRAFT_147233 [Jimgerdemannia flammicorona]|uniref:Uncharacterized protein n=1 Tax=Jimgerdemannia flammicorona TaxID=994334 RepID=A0A433D5U6_9FUNG|nr:hypothetical protein BC936DRAFT_147233 [Jimgerdemannia flammicorona]